MIKKNKNIMQRGNYKNIKIFPSPFIVPSNSPLVIDGLMDGSICKVITLTGRVLRTLPVSNEGVNGYQVFWDGKDEEGRWVNTGVYLIIFMESNKKLRKFTIKIYFE